MSSQLIMLLVLLGIITLGVIVTVTWLIKLYSSKKIIPRIHYGGLLTKFVYISSDEATLNDVISYGVSYYEGLKDVSSGASESPLYSVKIDVYNELKQYKHPHMAGQTVDNKLEVLAYLLRTHLISDDEYNTYRHEILSRV